jgi:thymidylate synthase (FAD)
MNMKVELFAPPYGDDLMVVNAARVSFDKQSEVFTERDTKLIRYLARGLTTDDFDQFVYDLTGEDDFDTIHQMLWEWRRTPEHFAPFAHPHVSFRITAPIFVARQLAKHQVGMVWSEVSRRYVSAEPEFYVPEVWRKAAENVKQGSSDEAVELYHEYGTYGSLGNDVIYVSKLAVKTYLNMLDFGVCPEQARMVLPQSMMTTWIWTGSLYGWANVFNKRKPGSHAQRECWPIAEQIASHMASFFPVSWEALTDVP